MTKASLCCFRPGCGSRQRMQALSPPMLARELENPHLGCSDVLETFPGHPRDRQSLEWSQRIAGGHN